ATRPRLHHFACDLVRIDDRHPELTEHPGHRALAGSDPARQPYDRKGHSAVLARSSAPKNLQNLRSDCFERAPSNPKTAELDEAPEVVIPESRCAPSFNE